MKAQYNARSYKRDSTVAKPRSDDLRDHRKKKKKPSEMFAFYNLFCFMCLMRRLWGSSYTGRKENSEIPLELHR